MNLIRKMEEFKRLGDLHPIRYDTNRPILDPVKHNQIEAYLGKSKDWQYEREHRLVRPLQKSEKRRLNNKDELYFVPMARSCVKAVYLGSRMENDLGKQIVKLMAGRSAGIYKNENFIPREFRLVFERVN